MAHESAQTAGSRRVLSRESDRDGKRIMLVRNGTPFSPFVFASIDEQDKPIHVVFCRGTFDLQNGFRLAPSPVQEPVVLADQYRKEPLSSSVQVDTDLVPFKHAADITINATAMSPRGSKCETWRISVRVGQISKSLRVTGPRHWQYTVLRGWHLSPITPVCEIPVWYEHAFGGRWTGNDEESVYEPNPVGMGYVRPKYVDTRQKVQAPQIENFDDPVIEFGRERQPAGWGPIAKHWLPRRTLCGTADDRWKESRWPLRPRDFDFRYYNCASPGLQYPGYLEGNEEVSLEGCSSDGAVDFALPGICIALVAMEENLNIVARKMALDTLHIDVNAGKVYLTWRSAFAKTGELESVDIAPAQI